MRIPTLGFIIEFWHRSWKEMLASLLALMALMQLAVWLIRLNTPNPPSNEIFDIVVIIELSVIPIVMGAGIHGMNSGYTLPVTTRQLVLSRMLHISIWSVLACVLLTSACGLVLGSSFPLIMPVLIVVPLTLWSAATLWSLRRSVPMMVVAGFLLVFLLAAVVAFRATLSSSRDTDHWAVHGWFDLGAPLAASILAVVFAQRGVAADRCGNSWTIRRMLSRLSALELNPVTEYRTFSSTGEAHGWFQWQHRGRWVVIGACAVLAVQLLAITMGLQAVFPDTSLRAYLASSCVVLTVLSLMTGLLMGHTSSFNKPLGVFGNFVGTQPTTDHAIGRSILRISLQTQAVVCGIWGMGFLLLYLGVSGRGGIGTGDKPWQAQFAAYHTFGEWTLLFWIVTFAVAQWTANGIGVVLTLIGRESPRVVVCLATAALLYIWLFSGLLLPEQIARPIQYAVCSIAGLTCVVVVVAAWVTALRREVIDRRSVPLAVIAWLALVAFFGALLRPTEVHPYAAVAFAASLLTLPLLPYPAAPLAAALNRHR